MNLSRVEAVLSQLLLVLKKYIYQQVYADIQKQNIQDLFFFNLIHSQINKTLPH